MVRPVEKGTKVRKSRAGGYNKRNVGFEGGQTPLHRRMPKSGFTSRKALVTDEIRLNELAKVKATPITLEGLSRSGFNYVQHQICKNI